MRVGEEPKQLRAAERCAALADALSPSQPGTIHASERWVIMDTRLPMTFVGELSVLTAYVAFAFVGAIVLGMI